MRKGYRPRIGPVSQSRTWLSGMLWQWPGGRRNPSFFHLLCPISSWLNSPESQLAGALGDLCLRAQSRTEKGESGSGVQKGSSSSSSLSRGCWCSLGAASGVPEVPLESGGGSSPRRDRAGEGLSGKLRDLQDPAVIVKAKKCQPGEVREEPCSYRTSGTCRSTVPSRSCECFSVDACGAGEVIRVRMDVDSLGPRQAPGLCPGPHRSLTAASRPFHPPGPQGVWFSAEPAPYIERSHVESWDSLFRSEPSLWPAPTHSR